MMFTQQRPVAASREA